MPEKFRWIVFRAHTSRISEEEESQPDFFGHFISPVSRREPEALLNELLRNRGLFLIEITNEELRKGTDDWGVQERLKAELERQGYAMSLIKTVARPVALD